MKLYEVTLSENQIDVDSICARHGITDLDEQIKYVTALYRAATAKTTVRRRTLNRIAANLSMYFGANPNPTYLDVTPEFSSHVNGRPRNKWYIPPVHADKIPAIAEMFRRLRVGGAYTSALFQWLERHGVHWSDLHDGY